MNPNPDYRDYSVIKSIAVCVTLLFSQPASTDDGIFLGINLTYFGDVGITAKVLSGDQNDELVFATGLSYYPFSVIKFGYDFGIGKTTNGIAGVWGVDIPHDAAYFSAGYLPGRTE